MTGFDIVVLIVVGMGAVLGFMRGFVQEAIALAAWLVVLPAVHFLHTPLAAWLVPHVHTTSGAAVLACARWLGRASRNSVLGPVDRVLGFGFGAVKGTLIVVLGFSVLVLGYDTVWGRDGRPDWITRSRTYTFVNACSDELVRMIGARRSAAADAASPATDED